MPSIGQVRFDSLLSNMSVEYRPEGRIADEVLPPVDVQNEIDVYWVYDKSRFNIPYAKRAPKSVYKEIDWTLSRDTYFAEEYGLEAKIDDRERVNAASPIDIDQTTTEILTDNLLNAKERRVSTLVLNTANYPVGHTVTLAGGAQWNTATSTPIDDIETGRSQIRSVTGALPNTIAMGYAVWSKLKRNAQIVNELQGERATRENVAEIFEVDEILVGTVLYNTANEGQAVALGDMWGKDVLLFMREARPALRRPAFGYQMRVQNLRVFRYRVVEINCDVIRVNHILGEKLVANQLGYLIKNAVA